ncbi:hypothetical protein K438DRAFT_2010312 [Mycena galopus ATCC 62051]|nr:hypothetical protein K438DRAFT_2010312 [Mycena galopus ATCC 62051]
MKSAPARSLRPDFDPYYALKLPVTPERLPPLIHLHTLILAIRDGFSHNPIIDVLDLLTAPSLQNLEIVGIREIQLPRQAFASFLERSGCTLQTLTLTFKDNLPFLPLQRNLQQLSSLSHFAILARGKPGEVVDQILRSLTGEVDGERLLPKLLSLSFKPPSSTRQLERLIMHNPPPTGAAREHLESFREHGLVVSYLPRYKPSRSALFI